MKATDTSLWNERPATYWDGGGQVQGDAGWTRGLPATPLGVVGEYLPPLEEGEVEIALVSLRSVTGDVISIRARRESDEIRYRVVDEYESDVELEPLQSTEPLSMAELGQLLFTFSLGEETGFLPETWERNLEGGSDPEDARDFVSLRSDFYGGIELWYDEAFDEWAAEKEGK